MTILTGYHLGDEKFAVKTEQTRLFGGYHLGSKKNFLAETVKFLSFSLATT